MYRQRVVENAGLFAQVEQAVAEGHSVTITVRGVSMRPLLRDLRDKVVLERVNRLRVGDIALFLYGDRHLLHRIRRIEGEQITMQGDALLQTTEECTREQVIATVSKIICPSGRVVSIDSAIYKLKYTIWLSLPKIIKRVALRLLK